MHRLHALAAFGLAPHSMAVARLGARVVLAFGAVAVLRASQPVGEASAVPRVALDLLATTAHLLEWKGAVHLLDHLGLEVVGALPGEFNHILAVRTLAVRAAKEPHLYALAVVLKAVGFGAGASSFLCGDEWGAADDLLVRSGGASHDLPLDDLESLANGLVRWQDLGGARDVHAWHPRLPLLALRLLLVAWRLLLRRRRVRRQAGLPAVAARIARRLLDDEDRLCVLFYLKRAPLVGLDFLVV